MKTAKVILPILVLMLCIVRSSFAQNTHALNLYLQVKIEKCQDPDKVAFYVYNMQNIRTTVMLMAEDGTLLYSRQIEGEPAWGGRLKLEDLPEGTYTFYIDQPGVRIMNEMLVTEKGLEIKDNKKYMITTDGLALPISL